VLFQGLDGLERMVAAVRETGAAPPGEPRLAAPDSEDVPEVPPAKKLPRRS